ncbi:MAG TPA: FmdB family zinc ribbon protein [Streptosporangiaceae bacterium]
MPTYQYSCTECGERVEAVQKFTDEPLQICSACGGKLRKVFSPVGIVFKGSGFYRNDSRSGSKDKALNGTGSSSDTKKDGASADSGSSDSKKTEKADAGSSSSSSSSSSNGSSSSAPAGSSSSSGSKVA